MNRKELDRRTDWSPSRFFEAGKPAQPYALILLNQPLNWAAFEIIVKSASVTVCADGGANRLRKASIGGRPISEHVPHAIIGDLDSLDSEVEEFYRSRGVDIVRDPDQYATDFTKCLKWLRQHTTRTHNAEGRLDVIALGGLGGRVDQAFSQIHHLYMAAENEELLVGKIYLLSEQSLSFVLEKGLNRIELNTETFAENVGIVPITGPAVITTKGLEWDVQAWKTNFGGQISTSNHWRSKTTNIETTTRVLFTVELASQLIVDDNSKT